MSGSRAHRLEVITRPERRRRYSVSDKLRISAECDQPGASVATVAERLEMSPSVIYEWRRLIKAGRLTPDIDSLRARATAKAVLPVQACQPAFVQLDAVRVEPTAIRLTLPGGVFLDFPVDLDPVRIAAVIRRLRGDPS